MAAPISAHTTQCQPKDEHTAVTPANKATFSSRRHFALCSSKCPKRILPAARKVVMTATSNQGVSVLHMYQVSMSGRELAKGRFRTKLEVPKIEASSVPKTLSRKRGQARLRLRGHVLRQSQNAVQKTGLDFAA